MCNLANHTIWCDCHTRPSLKEQLAQAHREGQEQCKMQQGMAQAYAEDNFSSRGKSVPRNGG